MHPHIPNGGRCGPRGDTGHRCPRGRPTECMTVHGEDDPGRGTAAVPWGSNRVCPVGVGSPIDSRRCGSDLRVCGPRGARTHNLRSPCRALLNVPQSGSDLHVCGCMVVVVPTCASVSVSCSVSCSRCFDVAGDRAGLRSDREGQTLGGDRLRCRYEGPVHGFERATDRSGDGWGLRQPCTRRPLPSAAQWKAMSS